MKLTTTRVFIILLTLFTAIVHLILLTFSHFSEVFVVGSIYQLFFLNGIAYLVLLLCLLTGFPRGLQRWLHYAYMAFAAITIAAWYVVNNGDFSSILGVSTKVAELALIVFLWLDLRDTTA